MRQIHNLNTKRSKFLLKSIKLWRIQPVTTYKHFIKMQTMICGQFVFIHLDYNFVYIFNCFYYFKTFVERYNRNFFLLLLY